MLGDSQFAGSPEDGMDWSLLQSAEKLAVGLVEVSDAASSGVSERFLGVIPNGFDPVCHDQAIDDTEGLSPAVRDL